MQLAYTFGLFNLQTELDALVVIQALNKKDKSPLHWAVDLFFNDILFYLSKVVNLTFV